MADAQLYCLGGALYCVGGLCCIILKIDCPLFAALNGSTAGAEMHPHNSIAAAAKQLCGHGRTVWQQLLSRAPHQPSGGPGGHVVSQALHGEGLQVLHHD